MSGCCIKNKSQTHIPQLEWFLSMIDNCYDYAMSAKSEGRQIVGIMCEFTPRELIMAADAIPVCLCGGDADTIQSAETELPVNLCPLIKSTYGYHIEKSNPFLEMADLIVAETTCDGKKKMFELMAETRPMHVLELPQKSNDSDAFEHWLHELYKLKVLLENNFDIEITDTKLRDAVRLMNRERSLRMQLAELMKSPAPPITGRQLLDLKSSISGIQCDLDKYAEVLDLLPNISSEDHRDKTRVLLTGVPVVHGAERVVDIIEDSGGLIVSMENCTGIKPIIENIDESASDIMRAIAEKYYHLPCSVMTKNTGRIDSIKNLANEYKADCVIELVWQSCITYDVESNYIKRLAEDELKIPYLRINTDYSPSDTARITVRVEALFETIRGKKTRKAD